MVANVYEIEESNPQIILSITLQSLVDAQVKLELVRSSHS